MFDQSLSFLSSIGPVLLGVGGVCAAIAIALAVMRHFAYEHDDDDTQTLKTRFIHVFGFIAALGVVVGGGSGLADSLKNNSISNQIAADAGNGFLPDGVAASTPSYDNMGDLINSFADEETHVSHEEAGNNIADLTVNDPNKDSWDNTFEDANEIYLNGQVNNALSGGWVGGF